jgi:hypothetical protein
MAIGHNGGPPLLPLTAKTKLECIQSILERTDLTAAQKCIGAGIVLEADKEWVAEVKTPDLQRYASAKDRETVFRATKELDKKGIVSKSSAKGQAGKFTVLPPRVVSAIVEAYEEAKSSRGKADRFSESGRVKPDGTTSPVSTACPVWFDPTSPGTGRVEADRSRAPVHARNETPSGLSIPQKFKEEPPFVPQFDTGESERIVYVNGKILLFNGLRSYWLEKFGGDELKLDLALAQAAGYVQPNNRVKPLEAQVSSQLAKMVRAKLDQDERYLKAAKNNVAKGGADAAKESDAERRARRLREMAAAERKDGQ